MWLVRPVQYSDLPALEQLAVMARGLVTTLPANRDYLAELVADTRHALAADIREPGGETYHFVLEDTTTGRVRGIAGIDSGVGLKTPFYSFRKESVVHASPEMQMHNRIPALRLCHEYTGASALCTFFIDPQFHNRDSLHLLSRARLLFINAHRSRFSDRILAEMQGPRNDKGVSPFWESLGRHFFSMDINQAMYLAGIRAKTFIADLLPEHPIYIPMLTEMAQKAIGEVHPGRHDVMDRLLAEGFRAQGCIDIFDGGPQLEARVDQLLTLKRCQPFEFDADNVRTVGDISKAETQSIVTNNSLKNFRCLLTTLDQQKPRLLPLEADLLQLEKKHSAACVSL
ncbi:arginine N-succinyltransferase [Endozoicomonadaceae bacterium StTr2]